MDSQAICHCSDFRCFFSFYIEKNNSLSNNSNISENNNNTILLSDNETELNYLNSKPQIEIIQNQIDFDPFPNYINI